MVRKLNSKVVKFIFFFFLITHIFSFGQTHSSLLTLDRIYSDEFQLDYFGQARWIDEGRAYTTLEYSAEFRGTKDIVSYQTESGDRTVLLKAEQLIPEGDKFPLSISNYIWSNDKSQLFVDKEFEKHSNLGNLKFN